MSRTLYLGVDGGATKTAAWVADERGFRGAGRSGPSAYGSSNLYGHVEEAVAEALRSAGATLNDVRRAVLGLSGADFPEDYALLTDVVSPLFGEIPFRIVNDTEVALVGGARAPWGVVSICGSGTNCLGRHPDGRSFTIGGMGYDGDYGGGNDLIRTAMARAFQADQGRGRDTLLRPRLLTLLGYSDYDALSRAIHLGGMSAALDPDRRRAMVDLVFAAAGEGDAVAQDILVDMGTALGHAAGAAVRRMLHADPAVEQAPAVEVVMAGSVWKGRHPLMADAFRLTLHRYAVRVDPHLALREPVAGAVLLAVQDDGGPVDAVRAGLPMPSEEENR
jgi:N-acetylglucosamine kinase-like BadF-type ATPase